MIFTFMTMLQSRTVKRVTRGIGAIISVLLAGCSIISPKARPEPEAYLLSIGEKEGTVDLIDKTDPMPLKARIMIEQEGGTPVGNTTRVLFITEKQTVGSYQFAQWAEPPTAVFQRTLYERLSKSNRLSEVTVYSGLVATDRLIRFRLDSFWLNNTGAAPARAQAQITVTIIDLEGRKTIARQTFSEEILVAEPSAEATVRSLTEAGGRIVGKMIDWIYETLTKYERPQ